MSDPALLQTSAGGDGRPSRLPADRMLLLRVDDVCDLLNLSRSTVSRLIANGLLPSVSVGRARRVERRQLEQFVASVASGELNIEPRRPGRKARS